MPVTIIQDKRLSVTCFDPLPSYKKKKKKKKKKRSVGGGGGGGGNSREGDSQREKDENGE